jgi:uncharacterized membrane protein YfcA
VIEIARRSGRQGAWGGVHARVAFLSAVPIAFLGGLIGLGGAEFRLPVLAGPLGHPARVAVPLNLAVSLVTIVASLTVRSRALPLRPIEPFLPAMLALVAGAVVAAIAGTALFARLSDAWLERAILMLLLVIGVALIAEAFLPLESTGILPKGLAVLVIGGVLFGLVIGTVSSLLGVAGGEIIIPTLVFAYGADIKTAGTASLMVSLPVVAVGIARYARQAAFTAESLVGTVAPMGLGSVVGALLGGLLAGVAPANLLKLGLGVILIASAWRTFGHKRGGRGDT